MKKLFFVLAFAGMAAGAGAQKTINDPNAEKRTVSGFHAISVSGGIDLYLSPGTESVAVSASETSYRDKIKTEVENGVLKIYYENEKGLSLQWGNRKLKAYVSYSSLDHLTGSGGSDIFAEGAIKTPSLELRVSGGSDFKGPVQTGDLKLSASGGSDIDITGQAKSADIDASGGSDVRGYEFSADICKVEASGGSDIYITVNRELSATASGGSDVYYKGSATVKEVKSSGSSSVKKKDAK